MGKRNSARKWKRRNDFMMFVSVIASVVIPPLGIYLVWRAHWKSTARYCLTGLAVACFALMVALLPSADNRVNGGIELVGRKPEAEIYGPDLPTATVTGYVAPVSQSVFFHESDDDTKYVYATSDGACYHLAECEYAFASAQRLTTYEAYFLGYQICPQCNPPAYVPGTIQ